MKQFFKNLLNLVLPPRCINCGKVVQDDDGLCEECFGEINFIAKPHCEKCGQPFWDIVDYKKLKCGNCIKDKKTWFRLGRSALEYDDFSKNMILSFKFMDKTENAKVLSRWLKLAAKDIISEGVDLLIPVPLHYTRLVKRRYNQSALLVRELSKETGIKADYYSLVRSRKTKPQVQFSGVARVKNVRGAFGVKKPENIKGKRVMIIDDVMTTGSTLKECAKALKSAGAKSVDFLTLARVCR